MLHLVISSLLAACAAPHLVQCTSTYSEPAQSIASRKVAELAEDFWQWKLRQYPEMAAHDRLNLYSEDLESFSFDTFDQRVNDCMVFRARCEAINMGDLNTEDLLTLKVLLYHLNAFIDGYKWRDFSNLNPINFMESVAVRGSPAWVYNSVYRSKEDYLRYIRRLQKIPNQIEEIINLMEKAIQVGRTNHPESMRDVVAGMSLMLKAPIEKMVYYKPFTKSLDHANMTQPEKMDLRSKGRNVVERIKRSFQRCVHWVEQRYMAHLRSEPGVGSWPNGTEYYRAVLQWYLTLDMDPEEVHRIGLEEVERIRQRMENVMGWHGFQGNLTQFLRHLRGDKSYYNHTKDELLMSFKNTMYNRIQPRLPMLFSNLDKIPNITILPMPYDGIAGAYGRNVFWINTNRPHTRASYVTLALSLHEGSHHLQVSYAKLQNLPEFRKHTWFGKKYPAPFRFPYFSAYAEGWGLYSEYLGEEMGLFQDHIELFGRYCYEMLRACRLVVDTGLHVKGWSREQAVEYLMKYNIVSRKSLETEVARYITWPGQACSYKIGEMKIKELRRQAEARLGWRFDVREFHSQILRLGGVPLKLLEESIHQWLNVKEAQVMAARASVLQLTVPLLQYFLLVFSIQLFNLRT